jgi:hypothetical protein
MKRAPAGLAFKALGQRQQHQQVWWIHVMEDSGGSSSAGGGGGCVETRPSHDQAHQRAQRRQAGLNAAAAAATVTKDAPVLAHVMLGAKRARLGRVQFVIPAVKRLTSNFCMVK